MNQKYELDEHGVHPLWNKGADLAESLADAIATPGADGRTDWANLRDMAAELVHVAELAIAEGPVEGLV